MLEALRAVTDRVILCRPTVGPADASGRSATDPVELSGHAAALGIASTVVEDPSEAVALARIEAASAGAVVLVCGSHRLGAALQD